MPLGSSCEAPWGDSASLEAAAHVEKVPMDDRQTLCAGPFSLGVVACQPPVAVAPSMLDGSRCEGHLPDISVMHVNIQGLVSHLAELSAVIRLSSVPPRRSLRHETFLNDSVQEVSLKGLA